MDKKRKNYTQCEKQHVELFEKEKEEEGERSDLNSNRFSEYMLNCIHFESAVKLISNDKNVRCRKRRFVYSTISFGKCCCYVSAVSCCCCCRCVCKREKSAVLTVFYLVYLICVARNKRLHLVRQWMKLYGIVS